MEQENKMQRWVNRYNTKDRRLSIARSIADNEVAVQDWVSMQDPDRIFKWGASGEGGADIQLVEKKFKDMNLSEYYLQMIMDITKDCKFD